MKIPRTETSFFHPRRKAGMKPSPSSATRDFPVTSWRIARKSFPKSANGFDCAEQLLTQRYMLDTDMVSCILNNRSPAARLKLAGLGMDDAACVSSISEAELRYGVAKAPNASRLAVLPWNSQEADAYGWRRAKQESSSKALGSMDRWIVAHTIAVDALLISRDKVFGQVPGLRAIRKLGARSLTSTRRAPREERAAPLAAPKSASRPGTEPTRPDHFRQRKMTAAA